MVLTVRLELSKEIFFRSNLKLKRCRRWRPGHHKGYKSKRMLNSHCNNNVKKNKRNIYEKNKNMRKNMHPPERKPTTVITITLRSPLQIDKTISYIK